jgi:hypothetical protein
MRDRDLRTDVELKRRSRDQTHRVQHANLCRRCIDPADLDKRGFGVELLNAVAISTPRERPTGFLEQGLLFGAEWQSGPARLDDRFLA